MYNKSRKDKKIEILEKWEKDWCRPDVFCKIDQRKKWTPDNMTLLRGHVSGEYPFVKFHTIQ